MSKTIQEQLDAILNEYADDVAEMADKEMSTVAQETVRKVKEKAPKSGNKGRHYRAGWKKRRDKIPGSDIRKYTVYQSLKPGLTHLLERGHVVKNQHGEYGRTEAKPHIEPAADWASEELVDRITDKLK